MIKTDKDIAHRMHARRDTNLATAVHIEHAHHQTYSIHQEVREQARTEGVTPKLARTVIHGVEKYKLLDAMPYPEIRVDYENLRAAINAGEKLDRPQLHRLDQAIYFYEKRKSVEAQHH